MFASRLARSRNEGVSGSNPLGGSEKSPQIDIFCAAPYDGWVTEIEPPLRDLLLQSNEVARYSSLSKQ